MYRRLANGNLSIHAIHTKKVFNDIGKMGAWLKTELVGLYQLCDKSMYSNGRQLRVWFHFKQHKGEIVPGSRFTTTTPIRNVSQGLVVVKTQDPQKDVARKEVIQAGFLVTT